VKVNYNELSHFPRKLKKDSGVNFSLTLKRNQRQKIKTKNAPGSEIFFDPGETHTLNPHHDWAEKLVSCGTPDPIKGILV